MGAANYQNNLVHFADVTEQIAEGTQVAGSYVKETERRLSADGNKQRFLIPNTGVTGVTFT